MAKTYLGQIVDHQILIIPSENLKKFIKSIQIVDTPNDMPLGIQDIVFSSPIKLKSSNYSKAEYFVTADDKNFINLLQTQFISKTTKKHLFKPTHIHSSNRTTNRNCLKIRDLLWLYKYIQKRNTIGKTKTFLHELLEGSEIVLPKNQMISRNEELDKRCKILEAEQHNKEYWTMTKNLNNLQNKIQDDSICRQIRMMNRHLIAVFQYIMSIITGFVFGFYGIEIMTTPLDLGFRLLLGVICSLAIALAELYFLAKALNMEIHDDSPIIKQKTIKVS